MRLAMSIGEIRRYEVQTTTIHYNSATTIGGAGD